MRFHTDNQQYLECYPNCGGDVMVYLKDGSSKLVRSNSLDHARQKMRVGGPLDLPGDNELNGLRIRHMCWNASGGKHAINIFTN